MSEPDDKPVSDVPPAAPSAAVDNVASTEPPAIASEVPPAEDLPEVRAALTAKQQVAAATAAKVRKPSDNDLFDDVGRWLAKYGALPALAIITIAIFSIHAHILGGEPAGDDLSFHFAESARIADCLRHFDLDLWNPSANGGYASAYYYQVLPQLASGGVDESCDLADER